MLCSVGSKKRNVVFRASERLLRAVDSSFGAFGVSQRSTLIRVALSLLLYLVFGGDGAGVEPDGDGSRPLYVEAGWWRDFEEKVRSLGGVLLLRARRGVAFWLFGSLFRIVSDGSRFWRVFRNEEELFSSLSLLDAVERLSDILDREEEQLSKGC